MVVYIAGICQPSYMKIVESLTQCQEACRVIKAWIRKNFSDHTELFIETLTFRFNLLPQEGNPYPVDKAEAGIGEPQRDDP
jgi:hypothetical protein